MKREGGTGLDKGDPESEEPNGDACLQQRDQVRDHPERVGRAWTAIAVRNCSSWNGLTGKVEFDAGDIAGRSRYRSSTFAIFRSARSQWRLGVLREVDYVYVDVGADVVELGERLAGGGTAAGGGALAHGKDHMIGLVNGGRIF